jgi:hypothetical protein
MKHGSCLPASGKDCQFALMPAMILKKSLPAFNMDAHIVPK